MQRRMKTKRGGLKPALLLLLILFSLLAEACAASGAETPKETESAAAKEYRIVVQDEEKAPVEGVVIQFCREDLCLMGTTDESGTVAFAEPEGVYEVHVLKAPEGFPVPEQVYTTGSKYEELKIMLPGAD